MRYILSWLYWVPALLVLCSWAVSTEDIAISTSAPRANTSAPMGLHGYKRYFANDSLIGRPVPCTRDDKVCFRHNLVYNPEEGRCGALGFFTIACRYEVNTTEFDQGSGRLVASCAQSLDPCTGYRMAYDGVCYEKEIVHDVICGSEATLTLHPFGDAMECRGAPARPAIVQQPTEDGSCAIPDLRFPDKERSAFFNNPYAAIQGFKNDNPAESLEPTAFECTPDQSACFSEGNVLVLGYSGCHTLLQQGPCADGHVVALDLQAATQGRAEGTCVEVRGGCPKGYKRMLFDGECHEDSEITIEAPGEIILNQFGSNIIVPYLANLRFSPGVGDDNCTVNVVSAMYELGQSPIVPVCGVDDSGSCKLYEVVNEPPMPDFN